MGGDRAQRRVLWATLVGVFVTSFPSVILVAALPDIARDFHVGETSVGWVLTAPMIAAAVLVPLFGRLGDLRGHRQVFLVGFGVSDQALIETAIGLSEPQGRLPIAFPASMDAVEKQLEDVQEDTEPYVDSAGNSYLFGFGLNYAGPIAG